MHVRNELSFVKFEVVSTRGLAIPVARMNKIQQPGEPVVYALREAPRLSP